jgi:hypothetical protein
LRYSSRNPATNGEREAVQRLNPISITLIVWSTFPIYASAVCFILGLQRLMTIERDLARKPIGLSCAMRQ